jgi:hypothetical protein
MADFNNFNDIDGPDCVNIADPTVQTQRVAVDASGRMSVNVANSAGAAAVNIQDGGNSITVDQGGVWSVGRTWTLASGTDSVAAVQSGTWNIGTLTTITNPVAVTQSGTWTVQQGTPPWSVAGNVASGAADSGNPVKVGGRFNTALPTLTNGQRGDIQLDSSGRLIIAPLTNSSIVKSQLQDDAGAGITSTLVSAKQSLDVNITAAAPGTDRTGTGTIVALNGTVAANTNGCAAVNFHVTGTWVATLRIEATVDGSTWITLTGADRQTGLAITTTTTNRVVVVMCSGFQSVRLIASLFTSGTASIAWESSAADYDPESANTTGNNGTTAPNQAQLVGGKDVASGNMYPLQVDNQGRLVTSAITGFGADFTFGDITAAALTRVLVKRTTYTEQTTNGQRSIASASVNDTAAGTGARTLKITYFDQTGAGPFTETMTLNGTTRVNTVATNICFIEQMEVLTAGSTGSNVGIITLFTLPTAGGTAIGTIAATNNQTFWAHHYVATGKICNITGISCGHNGTTVGSGALFTINALTIGLANGVESQVSDFVRLYGQTSTFARNYASPIKVAGPARLQVYVTPETASSTIYRAAFDFFEP